MIGDIRKFYEKTKLERVIDLQDQSTPPLVFIHVFHKEYPRLPLIPLPAIELDGELNELLKKRESVRVFTSRPMTLEGISAILRSCSIADLSRDPERRTYPSAGARFPIELYLVSFNINGIERGAYHYNMVRNALELLWQQDLREREKEIASPFLENPAAAIIFTSVISRSEVKYGTKAYPFSLIEAGHMGQNIELVCTKLGIGSCSIGGFVNSSVSQILDLTEDEIPLYVIGLGKPA